jgi:uncharacterized protein (TIGR03083 family)
MDITTHLDTLRSDGELFARAAERAGLDAPLPTCPDWLMRDLVAHLGGVHRWVVVVLESGRPERPTGAQAAPAFVSPGDGELIDWYRTAHANLLKALAAATPETVCWQFFEASSPLAFWARRQAHETAVHRIDAETAVGLDPASPVTPEFAVDGIAELLTGFVPLMGRTLVSDPPVNMAIAPDDHNEAWTLHISADAPRTVPGAAPATVKVTGPAEELYLLLWNRVRPARCRIEGDAEVLRLWRESAKVTF